MYQLLQRSQTLPSADALHLAVQSATASALGRPRVHPPDACGPPDCNVLTLLLAQQGHVSDWIQTLRSNHQIEIR